HLVNRLIQDHLVDNRWLGRSFGVLAACDAQRNPPKTPIPRCFDVHALGGSGSPDSPAMRGRHNAVHLTTARRDRCEPCHTATHGWKGSWPPARPGSCSPPVKGHEVRDAWFVEPDKWAGSMVAGYDASAVDDLLRRVADALDAGQPA